MSKKIEITRRAAHCPDSASSSALDLVSIKVNGAEILPLVEHMEFGTGTGMLDHLILTLRGKIVFTEEESKPNAPE